MDLRDFIKQRVQRALDILFQLLYGVEVDLIKPSNFLARPSDANFKVEKKYILEAVDGDPLQLKNKTLFQTSTGARGSVSNVETILFGDNLYYVADIDSGFDRDINVSALFLVNLNQIQKQKSLINLELVQVLLM